MLDKIKHVNSFGEVLEIGTGIYLNYSNLRDYGESSKTLPFVLFDKEETKDSFFNHFEIDVLSGNKGYFEINGYRLYGQVSKIANTNYLSDKRFIQRNITYDSDGIWTKRTSNTFVASASEETINDNDVTIFPFRWGSKWISTKGNGKLENNANYSSDALIKLYGASVNPYVQIGSNYYQVNTSILRDEYIEIDTKNRTIFKFDVAGKKTSVFMHRNKTFDIFKKIGKGTSIVTWNPTYAVEVILVEERGEPKWS